MTSNFGSLGMGNVSKGDYQCVGVNHGEVYMQRIGLASPTDSPLGYHFAVGSSPLTEPTSFGFYAHREPGDVEVDFPLWLPTLALLAINLFIWRETRAKFAGRAFPVEAASALGEITT